MNRVYGLQPWQMPQLTQHELTLILRDIEALNKASHG